MDKWLTKYQRLWAPDGTDGGGAGAPTTPDPTPAPAPTPDPTPAAAPAVAADPPTPAPVEPPAPVPEPNAVAKRIDQLTAEKYTAIRAAETAKEQLRLAQETVAQLKQAATPPPADGTTTPPAPTITPERLREMARVEAETISFNEKCNDVVRNGKAAFPDFDNALGRLQSLSPMVDARGQPIIPKPLIDAVLEAGSAEGAPKPADIIYALGKDTSEADRIMQLPPVQQAVAIARFAAKVPVKQTPGTVRSSAPPPITPAVSNGAVVTDVSADDEKSLQLPIGDWMKQRQKDLDKRKQPAT